MLREQIDALEIMELQTSEEIENMESQLKIAKEKLKDIKQAKSSLERIQAKHEGETCEQ